jgi:hypothetical protein
MSRTVPPLQIHPEKYWQETWAYFINIRKPARQIHTPLWDFDLFGGKAGSVYTPTYPHPYFGCNILVFFSLQTVYLCKILQTKELFAKSSRIRS